MPRQVPVGTPVGVPVGAPAAVPVGTPVGQASAAGAAAVSGPTAPPNPERSELRRKRVKENNRQLLLAVGGVGAGLMIVGGIVVAAMVFAPAPRLERERSTASVKKPVRKPKKPAAETDPAGGTRKMIPRSQLRGADLATIDSWLDATKKGGGGVKGAFRVQSNGAWRDNVGNVHVELAIQNTSPADTLQYRPWQTRSDADKLQAVIAIDDQDRPLTGVSGGSKIRELQPNALFTEELVFRSPPPECKVIRLVLPFAAFGYTDQIGLKIPMAALLDGRPSEFAGPLVPGTRRPSRSRDPILELDVDGAPPVREPMETSTLPDGPPRADPADAEKPKDDEKVEKPAKKEGGGEDDEDVAGMMDEEEKPAANQPP
jgi:hypothetical protein